MGGLGVRVTEGEYALGDAHVDTWNALPKHAPACRVCSGFRRSGAGVLLFAEAWARHWPPDCGEASAED